MEKEKISEQIKKALKEGDFHKISMDQHETYRSDLFSMCCISAINLSSLLILVYFLS
mgnify:FL=1